MRHPHRPPSQERTAPAMRPSIGRTDLWFSPAFRRAPIRARLLPLEERLLMAHRRISERTERYHAEPTEGRDASSLAMRSMRIGLVSGLGSISVMSLVRV